MRRYQAGKPACALACALPSHFIEALLEPSNDLVCLSHTVILLWHRLCSRALPHLGVCRSGRPPLPRHPAGFRGIQAWLVLPEACLGLVSELGTRPPPRLAAARHSDSEPGDRDLSAVCPSPRSLSWHPFLCSAYSQQALRGALLIACLPTGAPAS